MTHFTNPMLPGDYPDPSIVRVGECYYMTHSSFNYAPGLLLWRSDDLVHWHPLRPALRRYDYDVWAPDLVHHGGRFYIYYCSHGAGGGMHVIHADGIEGPWSEPIDLHLSGIDPGHVADPTGRRFLHLSDGRAVELASDGLATLGEVRKVYDGWPIPPDWAVEGLCLEGPKLFWRGDCCYLLSAQGGTAGPAPSHMVVAARARHPMGPWENCPHNPVVHTAHRDDRWWSRGHGTMIEAAGGRWWMVLHAYEKGFQTLGRQTLLEPMEWTEDGWPVSPAAFDPAKPWLAPSAGGGERRPAVAIPRDDCFAPNPADGQWRLWGEDGESASTSGAEGLKLQAKGDRFLDGRILCCIPQHHRYEAEVSVCLEGDQAIAGLGLFYSPKCHAVLAVSAEGCFLHEHIWNATNPTGDAIRQVDLRILNDRHEVAFFTRMPGGEWQRWPATLETSAWHHNAFGGFLSLRLALFAYGGGMVRFSNFRYRGL